MAWGKSCGSDPCTVCQLEDVLAFDRVAVALSGTMDLTFKWYAWTSFE